MVSIIESFDHDTCEEHCEHPDLICPARRELLADDTAQALAETFKILGDATRLKILHMLSNREMCVCDIAQTLTMNQSAISHQLRILRNARLVKFHKTGKTAWYSLDDEHVTSLMNQGLNHINHL